MNRYEAILDEQWFPYLGMTLEERNYYLNIIRHCKDICDTENKVDNVSKCELIELHLKKNNNVVSFNGSLTIGTDNLRENRTIEGDLFLEKDSVIVDYEIIRLCIKDEPKKYRVLDEFKIVKDKLQRRSMYNYNMKSIYDTIENEEMKGKLR